VPDINSMKIIDCSEQINANRKEKITIKYNKNTYSLQDSHITKRLFINQLIILSAIIALLTIAIGSLTDFNGRVLIEGVFKNIMLAGFFAGGWSLILVSLVFKYKKDRSHSDKVVWFINKENIHNIEMIFMDATLLSLAASITEDLFGPLDNYSTTILMLTFILNMFVARTCYSLDNVIK
jgi:hypothetical protein